MNGRSAIGLDDVPPAGQFVTLEPTRVRECGVEVAAEQAGNLRLFKDKDVVRLDVQAPETMVGRAAEHLEWDTIPTGDEYLVVLQPLEMRSAHMTRAGGRAEPTRCL